MLDLQHNELDVFPESLQHLRALQELNVSNNRIAKVEIGVEGAMPALKYLHINNNALALFDVAGTACLTSLRVLTAVRCVSAMRPACAVQTSLAMRLGMCSQSQHRHVAIVPGGPQCSMRHAGQEWRAAFSAAARNCVQSCGETDISL